MADQSTARTPQMSDAAVSDLAQRVLAGRVLRDHSVDLDKLVYTLWDRHGEAVRRAIDAYADSLIISSPGGRRAFALALARATNTLAAPVSRLLNGRHLSAYPSAERLAQRLDDVCSIVAALLRNASRATTSQSALGQVEGMLDALRLDRVALGSEDVLALDEHILDAALRICARADEAMLLAAKNALEACRWARLPNRGNAGALRLYGRAADALGSGLNASIAIDHNPSPACVSRHCRWAQFSELIAQTARHMMTASAARAGEARLLTAEWAARTFCRAIHWAVIGLSSPDEASLREHRARAYLSWRHMVCSVCGRLATGSPAANAPSACRSRHANLLCLSKDMDAALGSGIKVQLAKRRVAISVGSSSTQSSWFVHAVEVIERTQAAANYLCELQSDVTRAFDAIRGFLDGGEAALALGGAAVQDAVMTAVDSWVVSLMATQARAEAQLESARRTAVDAIGMLERVCFEAATVIVADPSSRDAYPAHYAPPFNLTWQFAAVQHDEQQKDRVLRVTSWNLIRSAHRDPRPQTDATLDQAMQTLELGIRWACSEYGLGYASRLGRTGDGVDGRATWGVADVRSSVALAAFSEHLGAALQLRHRGLAHLQRWRVRDSLPVRRQPERVARDQIVQHVRDDLAPGLSDLVSAACRHVEMMLFVLAHATRYIRARRDLRAPELPELAWRYILEVRRCALTSVDTQQQSETESCWWWLVNLLLDPAVLAGRQVQRDLDELDIRTVGVRVDIPVKVLRPIPDHRDWESLRAYSPAYPVRALIPTATSAPTPIAAEVAVQLIRMRAATLLPVVVRISPATRRQLIGPDRVPVTASERRDATRSLRKTRRPTPDRLCA